MTVKAYYGQEVPSNRSKYLISEFNVTPHPAHEGLGTVPCGVEIEVEKVGNKCDALHGNVFQVKEDHSLRNNGREIVTRPINSPFMVPAIEVALKSLPKEHDFSLRTSIHFHLSVQELSLQQIINILYVYILFEKCLYRFVHPSRSNNIFCVPIQETDLYVGNLATFDHLVTVWHKYTGLNLRTIKDFGTIEFRHLEGTDDIAKISNWFYLILSIYWFGAKAGDPVKLFEEISKLNTTSEYLQFARIVFGKFFDVLSLETLESDMVAGIKAVKETKRKTVVSALLYTSKCFLHTKLFPKSNPKIAPDKMVNFNTFFNNWAAAGGGGAGPDIDPNADLVTHV